LADRGYGVLFSSSELAEVIALADRILVMALGRITGEFTRQNVTEEQLVAASASAHVLEVSS
jgi:erythritol transport system ATP-binding protein